MWSPSYIKGNFFVGIYTTFHCEAFHSHVAKYVDVKSNLTDFIEQFQRCLTYFLHREIVTDHFSNYENVELETNLQFLRNLLVQSLIRCICFLGPLLQRQLG